MIVDECEYQCEKVCVGARVGRGGIGCEDCDGDAAGLLWSW